MIKISKIFVAKAQQTCALGSKHIKHFFGIDFYFLIVQTYQTQIIRRFEPNVLQFFLIFLKKMIFNEPKKLFWAVKYFGPAHSLHRFITYIRKKLI